MKTKKITSMIVAISMVITMLLNSNIVSAQDTSQGLELSDWTYTETDTAITLSKFIATSTNIVIPGEFVGKEGKKVLLAADTRHFPSRTTSVIVGDNNAKVGIANPSNAQEVSARQLFSNYAYLTTIDLSNLDTSNVTNMQEMFYDCSGLTALNLSNLDTSNVTNMQEMFRGCSGLTDFAPKLNTSNVTNMQGMFNRTNFKSLDLSSFSTSNVTNMSEMFSYAFYLRSLDLSNFDTSNVTDMNNMFANATSLSTLDISNFDTSKVLDMEKMFWNIGSYFLDLSSFDASNVAKMNNMFGDHGSGTVMLILSSDSKIKTMYGKVIAGKEYARPLMDANGGTFEDGTTIRTYFDHFVVSDKSEIILTKQEINDKITPLHTDATFKGWFHDRDAKVPFVDDNIPVNLATLKYMVDIKLYAGWEYHTTYTVTYNSMGGSPVDVPILSVDKDTLLTAPADPIFTGHGFEGWYTDHQFTTKWNFDDPVTRDMILFAKWNPIEYTVTYDTQGAGTIPDKTNVLFADDNLLPTVPAKDGYTFLGWKHQDTEVTEATTYGSLVADDTVKQIELVAQWEINKVSIDYEFVSDKNPEGITVPKDVTVDYGSTTNEPKFTAPKNWAFDGWYIDKKCTQKFDFTQAVTSNLTLFGKWTYTEPDKPIAPETKPSDTPKTSDTTNMGMLISFAVVSLGVLVVLMAKRKKEE